MPVRSASPSNFKFPTKNHPIFREIEKARRNIPSMESRLFNPAGIAAYKKASAFIRKARKAIRKGNLSVHVMKYRASPSPSRKMSPRTYWKKVRAHRSAARWTGPTVVPMRRFRTALKTTWPFQV